VRNGHKKPRFSRSRVITKLEVPAAIDSKSLQQAYKLNYNDKVTKNPAPMQVRGRFICKRTFYALVKAATIEPETLNIGISSNAVNVTS